MRLSRHTSQTRYRAAPALLTFVTVISLVCTLAEGSAVISAVEAHSHGSEGVPEVAQQLCGTKSMAPTLQDRRTSERARRLDPQGRRTSGRGGPCAHIGTLIVAQRSSGPTPVPIVLRV
jgi:hypothetical protein